MLEAGVTVPIFGLLLSMWGVIFIQRWNQRQNDMRVTWDLHHFESKDHLNLHYHGDNIVDENADKIVTQDYFRTWKRRLFSDGPLIILAMFMLIGQFIVV